MMPGGYNKNIQIFQTPDHVVIHQEMIHEARIIPLDGRPHHPLRQWRRHGSRPLGGGHAGGRDEELRWSRGDPVFIFLGSGTLTKTS